MQGNWRKSLKRRRRTEEESREKTIILIKLKCVLGITQVHEPQTATGADRRIIIMNWIANFFSGLFENFCKRDALLIFTYTYFLHAIASITSPLI